MSDPPICPKCGSDDYDSLHHYLMKHPGSPVPREIVLWWVAKDPGRCSDCHRPFKNMAEHCQRYHAPYIIISVGGYDVQIDRQDCGRFICPWCISVYRLDKEFKVCSRGRTGHSI